MKQIPQTQFEQLLMEVKAAKPITFIATTDARANKFSVDNASDPNPWDKILKKTRVNGFIGYDYEAAVNRQRAREGEHTDFVAGERKHGERLTPAVSETNGVRKMVVKVQSYLETSYFGVRGGKMELITEAEAKRFIREKTKPKNQGVDKLVDHKEYNISNIDQATLDGEVYEIVRA